MNDKSSNDQTRPRRKGKQDTAYELAKKAYALAKKAYKAPELKYYAAAGTVTGPSSSGSAEQLSEISQGVTNNDRIGDSIHAKSLHLRMKMNLNASATSSQVRVIIYKWLSESPSLSSSDILESASITSFKTEANRYQSQFLMDRVFTLNTDTPELFLQEKIKLGMQIHYNQAVTQPTVNGLYIFILSDEAANTPTLAYDYRVYFTDP